MSENNNISDEVIAKDIQTSGCPVCDRLWQAVLDFFSQWINILVNDEKIRKEPVVTLGLCPFHTWQMMSIGSPQGISRGYAKLMNHLAEELLQLSCCSSGVQEKLPALIKDNRECRVCNLMEDTETVYIRQLAEFLMAEKNRCLYSASHGLCLQHLAVLVAEIPDPEITQFLLTQAARRFAVYAADMKNYAIKHAKLQRHLCSGDEKYAYLRAITHAAGGKNVCVHRNHKHKSNA